jgi:preprotein translocase subunit YajC
MSRFVRRVVLSISTLSVLAALPLASFADGFLGGIFGGGSDASSSAAGGAHSNPIIQFLPLIVIIGLLYFVMIRPQMKQSKEHRSLLANLQVGDEVQTQAGIVGRVSKMSDIYVDLNIADNVEIKILKKAITGVVPKGTLKAN